ANFENVKFDADIEERKPFLRQLFDEIRCQLRRNEVITNVEHLSFRDRYIIEKDGAECVIDFEYNNEGFFGRVLPMERRCNSMELLNSIRTIVDNLKRAEYVSEGN